MAKKIIEIITSDLSGEELDRGQGETVIFSVGGADYAIDLTDAEAKDFYATFEKYTLVATKRSGRTGASSTPTSTRKSSGSGRSSEELAHIRAWANENGHQVSERGRIKGEIIEAFDRAND